MYESSHLFFLGDLNFRLEIPITHPIALVSKLPEFSEATSSESAREELKQFDQLTVAKNEGEIFVGFHEGDFWKFKCSYKYKLGKVDEYRYSFFVHAYEFEYSSFFTVQNAHHRGLIEYCTRHTLILQILPEIRTSLISYTQVFLPIRLPTM